MSRTSPPYSPVRFVPPLIIGVAIGIQFAVASARPVPLRTATPAPRPATLPPALQKQLARLPLSFTEAGTPQRPDERYVLRGKDKSFFFSHDGVTVSLPTPATRNAVRPVAYGSTPAASRWNARLEFLGSNPQAKLQGEAPTGTKVSYFTGPRATWRSGLQSFSRLRYRQLWQGVDLAYTTTADQVKHEFVVAPGADPNQIRLAYHGVDRLQVTEKGALEVSTPSGSFQDATPIAYQERNGQRVPVAVRFEVDEAAGDAHGYHFALGQYNRRLPLVIDPSTLVYAGFLGGVDVDTATAVAADASGGTYITGLTNSPQTSFPVTVGPDLTAPASPNAFIAKVRPDGTGFEFCGYIGGDETDWGTGVAVDDLGNAYVSGWTRSSAATFPVLGGPSLVLNGYQDAFIAKVSADGTQLVYCGYLGGSGGEVANGVAVDAQRRAYITGQSDSPTASFPVAVGPYLTPQGGIGNQRPFVARVAASGSSLEYCGYLNDSQFVYGAHPLAIGVDDLGSAYVVGYGETTDGDNYQIEGYATKVTPSGNGLNWTRSILGFGEDRCNAVAVRARRAYITGTTGSGPATLPLKGGPDLTYNGGPRDAFVACISPNGAAYDFFGYLGGSGDDIGTGIAVESNGNVYVTGTTTSTEQSTPTPFPVKVGPILTHSGGTDTFITKILGGSLQIAYSGFLGGSGEDQATGVAVDPSGAAHVVGATTSNANGYSTPVPGDFPTQGGLPGTNQGNSDGFAVKVQPNPNVLIGADLTGSWGEVIGSAAGSGVDLRISLAGQFSVRSIGTLPAGNSTVRLLLSTDTVPSVEDLVVAYEAVPALGIGANHVVPFNTELPSGVTDIQGRYLIGVVDYTDAVDEVSDANNLVVLGPLAPRPDLTGTWGPVTQGSIGSGANTQYTLEGDFQVQNIGAAPAGRYTVRLVLSTDTTVSANDPVVHYIGLPALAQGGTQTVHYQATLPKGVPIQGRYLIAIVDYAKAVNERDEGNNTVVTGPLP